MGSRYSTPNVLLKTEYEVGKWIGYYYGNIARAANVWEGENAETEAENWLEKTSPHASVQIEFIPSDWKIQSTIDYLLSCFEKHYFTRQWYSCDYATFNFTCSLVPVEERKFQRKVTLHNLILKSRYKELDFQDVLIAAIEKAFIFELKY
jgi:hypothetical protein